MKSARSEQLDTLCAQYWADSLARHPTSATAVAVHDHDSRLEDLSPESLEAWRSTMRAMHARVEAIDASGLSPAQGVTHAMLREQIEHALIAATDSMETWSVDQLQGPQVSLLDLVRIHAVTDATSMGTWLDRVRAMGLLLDQHAANIRRGLAEGLVAPQCTVARVVEQLDDQLAAGAAASPLVVVPAGEKPKSVGDAEWQAFRRDVTDAVERVVLPALARYRELLVAEVLPRARTTPGLTSLPGGEALYATCMRLSLSLDRTPAELHATGLAEVARIRREMTALCRELFPGMSLPEALRALRTDPRCLFTTREEIVEVARVAVRKATAAARECFDLLPDHECEVRPVDAHAEKSSAAAFYMPPAPDGTRPGVYFVNTCDPTERTRHESEAVAFHEAVPGHHLQLALAQKIDAPEFQKHAHSTAFAEGWALYTEALADELGLYSGPMDRLGMLSCDALRACRLVVDTGLHAQGWSRERAIEYMTENTAGSLTDIKNEVDRYVAWPGQALAYKVGQLEILALRERAQKALGPGFRLAAFHQAVLEHGGVTLPILHANIARFIEGRAS